MKKKERAKIVDTMLAHYFPDPPLPLDHKDPYTLLIAVLLAAQCTDARVNKVTPALFAKADTPAKMALLSLEEIEEFIKSCGFFRVKAKAIRSLSIDLVEKYGGQVPQSFEELESLQGVGHKTASVVLCQSFNIPTMPIDTHIHRCAKRWKLSSGKNVVQTELDLKKLFPKERWISLHLQIIYYGRKFCPARGHKIEECPICAALNVL